MTRTRKPRAAAAAPEAAAEAVAVEAPAEEAPAPEAENTEAEPTEAPAEEPSGEDAPEAAEPEVPEVKPEVPFGQDPDDAQDGEAEVTSGDSGASPSGAGVTATFVGLRGAEPFHPVAVTVIVPEDTSEGYEGSITEGTTYTLHRGQSHWVAEEHVEWLTNHPAYDIKVS